MKPMNDSDDDDLRGLLRELGRNAELRAPTFQQVWRAANEAQPVGERSVWRGSAKLTFAAAILLVGSVAVMIVNSPPKTEPVTARQHQDDAIMEPETGEHFDEATPTDFLLTANAEAKPLSIEQVSREITALLGP